MRILTMWITVAFVLSGCSTVTPARYAVSVDVNDELEKFEGQAVYLAQLDAPQEYNPNCRLMGPIRAGDGMTIPEFIQDAFNDEFKFADIYDQDNGVPLTGKMEKVDFSSSSGMTNGWWELSIVLDSPNGKSLSVDDRYEFKSGFDAITACNQTAQALVAAVQDLIRKVVSDPQFASLLE